MCADPGERTAWGQFLGDLTVQIKAVEPVRLHDAFGQAAWNIARAALDVEKTEISDVVARSIKRVEFPLIRFEPPATMKQGVPHQITVSCEGGKVLEFLKQAEADLRKEKPYARLTDSVEMTIAGTGFEITSVTPGRQTVLNDSEAKWVWEVRPTQSGAQRLHLTLNIYYHLLKESPSDAWPRVVRTLPKEIAVRAGETTMMPEREQGAAASKVSTPLGLLGLAIAAFLVWQLAQSRRKLAELKSLPESERAKHVDEYLSRYHISGQGLSPAKSYDLIREEMRRRFYLKIVFLVMIVVAAVICFTIAAAGFRRPGPGETSRGWPRFLASSPGPPPASWHFSTGSARMSPPPRRGPRAILRR